MKNLINKLIVILLPVILTASAFEYLARLIPVSYTKKYSSLISKANKIEQLILGASQTAIGINPASFQKETFNMANVSQDLYFNYKVLMKYLPRLGSLERVIITVDYPTLKSSLILSDEAWRARYYAVYLGIPAPGHLSFLNLGQYSALLLWEGPLGVIKNLYSPPHQVEINEFGYQTPWAHQKILTDAEGKKRVAFLEKGYMNDEALEGNLFILKKLLDELARRKIRVVFVTLPVHKSYFMSISAANYRLMTETIKNICDKHPAVYLNYFTDSRFSDSDFLDSDHLNKQGAEKFSELLSSDLDF